MTVVSNQTQPDAVARAFSLALQELSVLRLRKLGKHFKKATEGCSTRDEFVRVLTTTMTREQKLQAMR